MKIDTEAIRVELKAWLKERGYPETQPIEFVMNNRGQMYSHLLEKGLVPADKNVEDAFWTSCENHYAFKKMLDGAGI